ncbi:MAG: hypothetical protein JY451_12000 [Erythrobacter sp.]|nr:MAG: hypothetical protein JY451_12000 [Erythrobacter sp.]
MNHPDPAQFARQLPALVAALPGDHTRAPQTEFIRERQVRFLENLSVTGSVRSAATAAGVSHQTVYRARRATGAFRTAWDAALVVARANAEAVLAARAIDGVEESVFYHGEEVATRTRFCSRLLLAHLARLDRLAENPRAQAFAGRFDEALAAFERGEELLAEAAADPAAAQAAPSFSGHEPCNTRSMSPPGTYPPCPECEGLCLDPAAELSPHDCMWLGNRIDRMDAHRPAGAKEPYELARGTAEAGRIEARQLLAFEKGEDEWWLAGVVDPFADDWLDSAELDAAGAGEDCSAAQSA